MKQKKKKIQLLLTWGTSARRMTLNHLVHLKTRPTPPTHFQRMENVASDMSMDINQFINMSILSKQRSFRHCANSYKSALTIL